jgi:2-polyprenyl-3-methyl-5-hydroxy-6-metoxy-1,4-benzoquinol methylase
MDEPGLDTSRHAHALRGLSRLNWISDSAGVLWPPLAELAQTTREPLRVLDIATGGGDVPIRLAEKARRAKLPIHFEGCDLNPNAIEYARKKATEKQADVRFHTLDALTQELPAGYDVVMTSLFLHHLEEAPAIELLRRMGQVAGRMVLVNDLVRNYASYLLVYLGCRLVTRSEVVHVDGPLSVRAAFTSAEAREMAAKAGLEGTVVKRRIPCRWLLTWRRP